MTGGFHKIIDIRFLSIRELPLSNEDKFSMVISLMIPDRLSSYRPFERLESSSHFKINLWLVNWFSIELG
jgi:hypothetical protein